MKRRRLYLLLGMLLFLSTYHLVATLMGEVPPTHSRKVPAWLTQQMFYQFIDVQTVPLPGGESLTLRKERVESLHIKPTEDPDSEAADVSFVVRTDQGRYRFYGLMDLYHQDETPYLVVNLGKGWAISKE